MWGVETTFSGRGFRVAKSKLMFPHSGTVFPPLQCLLEVTILLQTAEGVSLQEIFKAEQRCKVLKLSYPVNRFVHLAYCNISRLDSRQNEVLRCSL